MTSSTPKPTAKPTMPPRYFSDLDLAILTTAQGFKILGEASSDNSGYSVASAGDINGDGYSDIIIGAPGASYNTGDYAGYGVSYVIFGGPGQFKNIDLVTLTSDHKGLKILDTGESSVASAGDFNGDGCADLIIGNYREGNSAGATYLIFGKFGDPSNFNDINLANLSTNEGFKILGESSGDEGGYSVASAGDINGDGYSDIIIGAYRGDPNSKTNAGISYVIFGKFGDPSNFNDINLANLSTNEGFKILGENSDDLSGMSVASAGDINGDGYADIIIGAEAATANSKAYAGISYVIFGKNDSFSNIDLATISASEGFKILGAASGDFSGYSVASAGDVNSDGYADIIIGAYEADPKSRSSAGTTYIILGKLSGFSDIDLAILISSQGFKILGAASGDYSGRSVASSGDVNGDGYADIIIGAYGADLDSKSQAGISYVITDVIGTFSPTATPTIIATKIPTYLPTITPTVAPTAIPTLAPTVMPIVDLSKTPTLEPTIIPTATPTSTPTAIPIKFFTKLPTFSLTQTSTIVPTDLSETSGSYSKEPLQDRLTFKWATSSASAALGLIAGWIFREKIAFHIINNWGYSYKLLHDDDKKISLPAGEIGIRLAKNKNDAAEVLVCRIKDKYTKVEIDNGNNNGISEGLYNIIFERLKQPEQFDEFIFLESEKNQLRDFLLSHKFIRLEDLGYIRGSIYKLFLDNYKIVHKEKYSHITRKGQDDFRLSDQNPLHDQIDFEGGNKQSGVEMRPSASNNLVVIENTKTANDDISNRNDNSMLLSIDAMMDPEYVRLQNEEFVRFGNQLINFINEVLPKDINLLLSSKSDSEPLLLENAPKESQTVTIYEGSTPADNSQFFSSNNLMLSLLNAKQILYNLPMLHYVAQNTINYLGYNITLPDPLDNKAVLISVDLILGNLAAQYLPAESAMSGIFISTASTASYAVRLIAADYLKNQELSEDPIEFAQQCAYTIAAHSLPGVVNYALTKAILPDAEISISTLDVLGSSSFGLVQCYNNYKAVYGAEAKATTTDIVVPYIADAITLWSLRGYLNFDASNTASLMASIKNAMSVAATTYATDCVARMVMYVVLQEVKEEYIEPIFDYAHEAAVSSFNNFYNIADTLQYLFNQDNEL